MNCPCGIQGRLNWIINIKNLGRAGPWTPDLPFPSSYKSWFSLFFTRWTKNATFWLRIFVDEPEEERGRDFTWHSLAWVIPFTNSREPHGLRIPLWADASDGSIVCWPNLLTVTITGPRPCSGSPTCTKILNLRCKNKKDAIFDRRERKEKNLACIKMKKVSQRSKD